MATNPDVAMEKARRRFLMVWTAVGAILLTGAAVYLINILSVPIGILLGRWSSCSACAAR